MSETTTATAVMTAVPVTATIGSPPPPPKNKGGRPPGSKNKPKSAKKKPKPRNEKEYYNCMCCANEKAETEYYFSKYSKVWNYSNSRVLICKSCIDALLKEFSVRYGERMACAICCSYMDIPFYATAYQSIIDNNMGFSMGLYARQLSLGQFKNQTFMTTILSGELNKTSEEVKDKIESAWTKADKQNMEYAISVVGYDPFDDMNLTNNDRKYAFNVLAGYCDDESIKRDVNKLQAVIQITYIHLQCRQIDASLNLELASGANTDTAKTLSSTKKTLFDSLSKLVQDNNLASNYNDNSRKGKDTLSDKMKEMAADNFKAIEINVFDVKRAEAMKQIADLSNKSIMEQLTFDANDYTDMIREQREIIAKLEKERDEVTEEYRVFKNIVNRRAAKDALDG